MLGKTVLKILGKGSGATLLFDVSYPNLILIFKSSWNLKQYWLLFAQSLTAANFCMLSFPPPQLLQHYPNSAHRS